MASSGSGKPGPFSARRWSPHQKPIRFLRPPSWKLLNQQRRIALHNSFLESPTFCKRFPMCDAYLQHQAHVNHTGPEDLQPQEAEPKGEKVEKMWSSTRVLEGHQQVDEDPGPAFTSEGQLGHSTEGKQRPKVHFASCGSGEPGPSSGWRSPSTKKPTRSWKPPTSNQRQNRVLSSILDPVFKPLLELPKHSRKFPAFNYLRPKAHDIYTGPDYLVPEEAEHKALAQEAEEAPAETPEVQTEASDEGSDEELEAWAPPEVQPPASASPVAAVELGPAWEAPADLKEATAPLDEEPSLEPAQGPASEEELPPETPAGPAPELVAETAHPLPSEKLVPPPLIDL
uniref:Uncharacterized protein n=1 Tax=Pipistrellus kuhlii TaxID=59472 RepID=A0A7J7XVB7_PIPKU|nr:hypothetical protein mPipKuh1_010515 [Pipistrellus kuhlii]